jgi:hypothetical protein
VDRAGAEAALERGKDKLGSISKQGDRYLRSLFTASALAVIRYAKTHGSKHRSYLAALLTRLPTKVAAIALAYKIARMASANISGPLRWKGKPISRAAAMAASRLVASRQAAYDANLPASHRDDPRLCVLCAHGRQPNPPRCGDRDRDTRGRKYHVGDVYRP